METIHIQSFVAAPPQAVWDRLLGSSDIVLDALPLAAWPDQREERAPSRLTVRWPHGPGAGPTSVEILLEPVSGGTRVDLRHDGWESGPSSDDAIAGHFAGWLQALAALGLLVETGRDPRASSAALGGRERYFASAEVPAGAAAVYRALTDAEVLARWSEGVLDGAAPKEEVENHVIRWSLPAPSGAPGELVVILRRTPRGTHCALAEYGVSGRAASARWPAMLERLAAFLR